MNTIGKTLVALAAGLTGAALPSRADVTPHALFADNAVLQQGMKVPVWGTADPDEGVIVKIAGQTVVAITGANGKWIARLGPMKAGGPHTMTITGKNSITLTNVLVGEVWLCSGQSNMERQLGLRAGQQPIRNWEREAAAAQYPELRHFGVAQQLSFTPETTVKGNWVVCSPQTVTNFTAVGFFFGRELHLARHVPVGLIHSSWGGTPAEAWTSETALAALPDFAQALPALQALRSDPDGARRNYEVQLENWFRANDPGSAQAVPSSVASDPAASPSEEQRATAPSAPGSGGEGRGVEEGSPLNSLTTPAWSATDLDTTSWKQMSLPALWESAGEPGLNGVVWFRRTFDLPETCTNAEAQLDLGMIDDIDTTWINGVRVGAMNGYNLVRQYPVPAGVLKPGRNVVAVRVLDLRGGGGLWGDQEVQLIPKAGAVFEPIALSGLWQYRVSLELQNAPQPPMSMGMDRSASAPTVLYNGMIAPLVPYGIRGVIWYQGESNVGREQQYQTLFPAMIADWRGAWREDDLPFLFVQIAPHADMSPEIREAQLIAWQRTKNTAMAVTMDCGDANDIHPTHKQPVGARLALAARALAYREQLEYSGPIYESMKVKGNQAVLSFTHLGGGLLAKDGPLKGFTIAGPDKNFRPAHAEISGKTVVVRAESVAQPMAVRYGWANVPEGNLYSRVGLPASPFRTDRD